MTRWWKRCAAVPDAGLACFVCRKAFAAGWQRRLLRFEPEDQ